MEGREKFPSYLLPDLVQRFVRKYELVTDAPDEFLAASALYVGAVLAGRWIVFNNQPLNNYFLVVGSTGTSRKSTAQKLASDLLRAIVNRSPRLRCVPPPTEGKGANAFSGPDTAYPIVTHFSIEGLHSHAIGVGTSTAVMMGEYGSLFKIEKRQSQGNTISELTNMYDGNLVSVKTVSRNVQAEGYSVSLLGASTASWLADFCSGENISGGFVNRHLLFTGQPERILANPEELPAAEWNGFVTQYTDLIPQTLRHTVVENRVAWQSPIKKLVFEPATGLAWTSFYTERIKQLRSLKTELLQELSGREMTHSIKLAGLCAFLEGRDLVGNRDLEFGVKLARWSTRNAIELMVKDGVNQRGVPGRLVAILKDRGPLRKTEIARVLGGKQDDVNRAIKHLVLDGVIVEGPDGYEFCSSGPNSQLNEVEQFFGISGICRFFEKPKLEVESVNGAGLC